MVNSLFDNYANCTTFKLCNENEDFSKHERIQEGDKDYRHFMMLSTPPSNSHKNQKFILAHSTTNNNGAVIENSPHHEKQKIDIKPTTMFATGNLIQPTRAQLLLQTPPFQNFLSKANLFQSPNNGLYNNSNESQKNNPIKFPRPTHG